MRRDPDQICDEAEMARLREQMAATQLAARGIDARAVLSAFREIPREVFVPSRQRAHAYEDRPLPIGAGQTISQPYMVALMTQELNVSSEKSVLEIGTGSGYQTAVLAFLSLKVHSVERIPSLSQKAGEVLAGLGLGNVELRVSDGTLGWPGHAPYDRIIVTAGSPDVPQSLLDQLAEDGVIVIPVGGRYLQDLRVGTKTAGGMQWRSSCRCRFVRLIGEEGWG